MDIAILIKDLKELVDRHESEGSLKCQGNVGYKRMYDYLLGKSGYMNETRLKQSVLNSKATSPKYYGKGIKYVWRRLGNDDDAYVKWCKSIGFQVSISTHKRKRKGNTNKVVVTKKQHNPAPSPMDEKSEEDKTFTEKQIHLISAIQAKIELLTNNTIKITSFKKFCHYLDITIKNPKECSNDFAIVAGFVFYIAIARRQIKSILNEENILENIMSRNDMYKFIPVLANTLLKGKTKKLVVNENRCYGMLRGILGSEKGNGSFMKFGLFPSVIKLMCQWLKYEDNKCVQILKKNLKKYIESIKGINKINQDKSTVDNTKITYIYDIVEEFNSSENENALKNENDEMCEYENVLKNENDEENMQEIEMNKYDEGTIDNELQYAIKPNNKLEYKSTFSENEPGSIDTNNEMQKKYFKSFCNQLKFDHIIRDPDGVGKFISVLLYDEDTIFNQYTQLTSCTSNNNTEMNKMQMIMIETGKTIFNMKQMHKRNKIFQDLTFNISKMSGIEQEKLGKIITAEQGILVSFDSNPNYMVCTQLSTQELEFFKESNGEVEIVTPQFVIQCTNMQSVLDSSDYSPVIQSMVQSPNNYSQNFILTTERRNEFIQWLKSQNLILREELADNNCLFRSISRIVYNNPDHYMFMRNICGDYMDLFPDRVKPFLDGVSIEEYRSKIAKTAYWGGEPELMMFADIYLLEFGIFGYNSIPMNTIKSSIVSSPTIARLALKNNNHYNTILQNNNKPLFPQYKHVGQYEKARLEDLKILITSTKNNSCSIEQLTKESRELKMTYKQQIEKAKQISTNTNVKKQSSNAQTNVKKYFLRSSLRR